MPAQTFAVQPYNGFIINSSKVEEKTFARLQGVFKMLSIPHSAFIIVQLRALCIPVTGNKQQFIRFKIILLKLGLIRISLVLGITAVIRFQTIVIITVFKGIYNRFPLSVKGRCLACADIHDLGNLLPESQNRHHKQKEGNTAFQKCFHKVYILYMSAKIIKRK